MEFSDLPGTYYYFDNARIHIAKNVMEFLRQEKILYFRYTLRTKKFKLIELFFKETKLKFYLKNSYQR